MKHFYKKEEADYLNNKFGDDFTLAEPYSDWIKPQEKSMNQLKAMKELEFKCWCDVMDDLLQQIAQEEGDDERNIVGYYEEVR